jgi:hypothetical protein
MLNDNFVIVNLKTFQLFYTEDGDSEIANFTKSENGILVIKSEGSVIILCLLCLNDLL